MDEAIAHYQKALQINPDYAEAYNNLGNALLQKGQSGRSDRPLPKGAANQPRLRGSPQQPRQRSAPKGQVDEAIAHYQKALQIKPDYAEAHNNLGNALLQKGRVDEAIAHYQKALQIKPDNAEAHYNLGNALLQKGRVDEAIAQYQKALQIKPDSAGCPEQSGVAAGDLSGRTHPGWRSSRQICRARLRTDALWRDPPRRHPGGSLRRGGTI